MTPLVSCIVTTHNRSHFLPQLVRCIRAQTYPRKELIIVEAGEGNGKNAGEGIRGVRHLRLDADASIADCLNHAVEQSHGEILQKVDDDDYYAPGFVTRAVTELLASSRPSHTIVAWDCFQVLMHGEQQLRFSGHGWAAGGTFCFTRELWSRTPYRGRRAEDYALVQDSGAQVVQVCAPELYMYVRHRTNGWQSMGGEGASVDAHFRSLRPSGLRVEDVTGRRDAAFYRSLTA